MKKLTKAFGLIVVVLIIALGAWFLYRIYDSKTHLSPDKWATFENSEYKVSFKYPQDVFTKINTNKGPGEEFISTLILKPDGWAHDSTRKGSFTIFDGQDKYVYEVNLLFDSFNTEQRGGNIVKVYVQDMPLPAELITKKQLKRKEEQLWQPSRPDLVVKEIATEQQKVTLIHDPLRFSSRNYCYFPLRGSHNEVYIPAGDHTLLIRFQTCGLQQQVIEDIVASIKIS